ncbi:MAG: molecular chaperone HtpG [Verrucomicrobia bacterium]|nr:MAG: molecular chaperone HtpG [Verrucomicrobiota bacterium]
MTKPLSEKHEFQAEVKQLLNIVIHSLYTDKEIFVRELVANASDALEKLRHLQLTEKNIYEDFLPLEITINADEEGNTITIQDHGIGMTNNELIENLGTIAHSGSKSFLESIKESGATNENLIGQFGVGFYSAFMVAEKVEVFTHSWKPDEKSYCWSSEGLGDYTITETPPQSRGCKIVIKLKEDSKEFSNKETIKRILERYSNFIQFPINLNGEKVNKFDALWLRNKSEIKDEEYKDFYKFQSNAFEEPLSWLHFNADAPLEINALLYIPSENMERFGAFGRMDSTVALYCRKVLIDASPKGLLPEWLRFLKGLVDSADLPLNISRQTMQDSALVQKLNRVLTKRFLKHLEEMASKKPEEFKEFWKKFDYFLKEGITTDFNHREQLAKLLRYESSFSAKDELISLADYVSRMKEDQKEIYYLIGADRASLENSPYYEAFKARGIEVLFMYEPIDDFVISHLGEFEGKKFASGDQSEIELSEAPSEPEGESMTEDSIKEFCEWFKKVIGENKVESVTVSNRLVSAPILVLHSDKMMNANMRRMYKLMKQDNLPELEVNLQINPKNNLIKSLYELTKSDENRAEVIANQLFDNALMSAGLLENPRNMVERMYKILEIAAKN